MSSDGNLSDTEMRLDSEVEAGFSGEESPTPTANELELIRDNAYLKTANKALSQQIDHLNATIAELKEALNKQTLETQQLKAEFTIESRKQSEKLDAMVALLQKQQNTGNETTSTPSTSTPITPTPITPTQTPQIPLATTSAHTTYTLQTSDIEMSDEEGFTPVTHGKKRRSNAPQYEAEYPNLPKTTNATLLSHMKKSLVSDPRTKINKTHSPSQTPVSQNAVKTPTQTGQASAGSTAQQKTRVPPIILREKKKYNEITSMFKNLKLDYGKGKVLSEGIKIHPATPQDYNQIWSLIVKHKIQAHSFRFSSEKQLHVVIKGVDEEWSAEKIKIDLEELGFNPERVIKWNRRDGTPTALCLVILPKDQVEIFKLKDLDNMIVKVESQKTRDLNTQCHRCQMYGHSQFRCTATVKCLKCAGEHMSYVCDRESNEIVKCANCGGDHPANHIDCPRHPKKLKAVAAEKQAAAPFKWGQQNNAKLQTAPATQVLQTPDLQLAMQPMMSQIMAQVTAAIQQQLPLMLPQMLANAFAGKK